MPNRVLCETGFTENNLYNKLSKYISQIVKGKKTNQLGCLQNVLNVVTHHHTIYIIELLLSSNKGELLSSA